MNGSIKHKLKTKLINLKLSWWLVKNAFKVKLEKWIEDNSKFTGTTALDADIKNLQDKLDATKKETSPYLQHYLEKIQTNLDSMKKNIDVLKEKNKAFEEEINKD